MICTSAMYLNHPKEYINHQFARYKPSLTVSITILSHFFIFSIIDIFGSQLKSCFPTYKLNGFSRTTCVISTRGIGFFFLSQFKIKLSKISKFEKMTLSITLKFIFLFAFLQTHFYLRLYIIFEI